MAKLEKTKPNFFKRMFMDDNDINEKSIVGFGAFLVMVIAFGVDIYTGVKGMPFEINEFIFDGFMVITFNYLYDTNRNILKPNLSKNQSVIKSVV